MIRVVVLTCFEADRAVCVGSFTPFCSISVIATVVTYIEAVITCMNTPCSCSDFECVVINSVNFGNEEPHTVIGGIFKACCIRDMGSGFTSLEVYGSNERVVSITAISVALEDIFCYRLQSVYGKFSVGDSVVSHHTSIIGFVNGINDICIFVHSRNGECSFHIFHYRINSWSEA